MLIRTLVTLTFLGLPASAQCIVDRILDPEGDAFFATQGAVSGPWLAIGDESNTAKTFEIRLYREESDGQWVLTQTLAFPGGPATRNEFALDGERLFVSTAAAIQGYEVQGDLWQPAGAPVSSGWDVVELEYDEPLLVVSNPSVFDPPSGTVLGRARVYRVDGSGGLDLIQGLNGSAADEQFGQSVDVQSGPSGNGTVAIGSPRAFPFATEPGAVRIYTVNGSQVQLQDTVSAPGNPGTADLFGRSVALGGGLLAVHSAVDDRVDVFRRNAVGAWGFEATLIEETGQLVLDAHMEFDGQHLVLSDTDPVSSTTLVRLYERTQGNWSLESTLSEPGSPGTGLIGVDLPVVVSGAASSSGSGSAWLWNTDGSGCPGLLTSPATASLATGQEVRLITSFGPDASDEVYIVLGSRTGTSPGLPLGGVTLPLVVDVWTNVTLVLANQTPFQSTFGALDGLGGANSLYTVLPQSDRALAGLTLFHATLTLDGQTAAPLRVSEPSALVFVP